MASREVMGGVVFKNPEGQVRIFQRYGKNDGAKLNHRMIGHFTEGQVSDRKKPVDDFLQDFRIRDGLDLPGFDFSQDFSAGIAKRVRPTHGDFHNSDCPVFKRGDFNRCEGDVPQNSNQSTFLLCCRTQYPMNPATGAMARVARSVLG